MLQIVPSFVFWVVPSREKSGRKQLPLFGSTRATSGSSSATRGEVPLVLDLVLLASISQCDAFGEDRTSNVWHNRVRP